MTCCVVFCWTEQNKKTFSDNTKIAWSTECIEKFSAITIVDDVKFNRIMIHKHRNNQSRSIGCLNRLCSLTVFAALLFFYVRQKNSYESSPNSVKTCLGWTSLSWRSCLLSFDMWTFLYSSGKNTRTIYSHLHNTFFACSQSDFSRHFYVWINSWFHLRCFDSFFIESNSFLFSFLWRKFQVKVRMTLTKIRFTA